MRNACLKRLFLMLIEVTVEIIIQYLAQPVCYE